MMFFDDMRHKYGFSDGSAMPDGVEKYREVYIRILNKMAETLGSGMRAYAYDRGGCHNWCLLLFAPVAETAVFDADVLARGIPYDHNPPSVQPDELMEIAIESLCDMDLAACVNIVATLDELVLSEMMQAAVEICLSEKMEAACGN